MIDAVHKGHKAFADPGLIIQKLRFNMMQGLYKIILNKPVPVQDYKLYVHKDVRRTMGGCSYGDRHQQMPGTIVIFNDAYVHEAKKIPGASFD